MNRERIENYVGCLLESWAVYPGNGDEGAVWQTLHDLLMAVSRYELMDAPQRALTSALCKKLQHHFETKFSLKERKRKTKKENVPPYPLLKEKEKKEKEEKAPAPVRDADLEAFRKECLGYVGQYDQQLVAGFYNYWAERDATGRMRWQRQRFWNTEKRMARWVKNSYASADTAAAERLKKVRKQPAADQQQQTQEREEANDQLEREIAESKRNAVSFEEWKKMRGKS